MEREYKIDNLRAIAILLVVLGHSIIIYDPNWGVITSDTECLPFFYLKQMINLIQMPLFFQFRVIASVCQRIKTLVRICFW